MNVGVIGLGAGTLMTYARPVDHYTVYDINPAVPKIAATQFTFLRDCMAPHEIVLGDVQPPGKRMMPATDWARGARIEPGELFV